MNPAADQCEALGCPGEMIQGPWQPFFFGRGGTPDNNPFKWGYALCVGIEAMADCFVDLWDQLPTNKKVGLLYTNTTDGQAWGDEAQGGPFFFTKGGYEYTMPSFFQPGAEDFTQQISEFKKFGAGSVLVLYRPPTSPTSGSRRFSRASLPRFAPWARL